MLKRRILAVFAALSMLPFTGCEETQTLQKGSTLTVDLTTGYLAEPFEMRGGAMEPLFAVSSGVIAEKEGSRKIRFFLYQPETDEYREFQLRRREVPSFMGELPDGRFIFLYNDSVARESGLDIGDGVHRTAEIFDADLQFAETFALPPEMPAGCISRDSIAMDRDGNWVFTGNSDTHFSVRGGVPKTEGLTTGYYVLNPDFTPKAELHLGDCQPMGFVPGASGKLYGISGTEGKGMSLCSIDCGSGTAEVIEQAIPTDTRSLMTGREHELCYAVESGIYSWDPGEKPALLVDFVNSDLADCDCGWGGYSLPDGSYLVYCSDQDSYQADYRRLLPRPADSLAGTQIVTLAGVNINRRLMKDVTDYNHSQQAARIVIKDYGKEWVMTTDDQSVRAEYAAAQREWRDAVIDYTPAVEAFKSDLLTGTVPDILCMDAVSYPVISNKGLLCDLMPLLRADPRFEEERYMDNILDGLKRGDHLERIGFSFTVDTMAAKTQFVGEAQQRSADAYLEMLRSASGTMQYLPENSRESLIQTFLVKGQGSFIDRASMTCSFNSPAFIDLLEMVNAVKPADRLYNADADYAAALEYGWNYSEDHTLLCPLEIVMPYQFHETHFRDFRKADITLVGYPEAGEGNGGMFRMEYTVSLTSQSACGDYVLDFILRELSPKRQSQYCVETRNTVSLPLLRDMLENSMLGASRGYHAGGNMTTQEVDVLKDYLSNVRTYEELDPNVTEVILEESGKYFAGDCDAAYAARSIQSRVSLYLAEQS